VNPELFAKALTRLEDVNLNSAHITYTQIQALFTAMSQNSQLKKLELERCHLSFLEQELFANSLTRLEDVNLNCARSTYNQIQALFTAMSQNSQLKKLGLGCNNLYTVNPELFAKALTRLEDVDLNSTLITNALLVYETGMS